MTSQPTNHLATRYELTFSLALAGSHRPPAEVVIVHPTAAQGPGGHPIYSDETGAVRAEISDRGEFRMIATSAHQRLRRPARCRALPVGDSAVAA